MSKPLEQQLAEYFQTSAGRTSMRAQLKQASAAGSGLPYMDNDALLAAAKDMREVLIRYFHEAGLTSIEAESVSVGNIYTNEDGDCCIDLLMDEKDLSRPSLVPKKYPNGAYNIVTLFTRGWTSNKIHGYWESRQIYVGSRTHKSPDPIVENAVKEFEQTHAAQAIARMK